MEISSFNPTSGDVGTGVRLALTGMPEDASSDNTAVQLSGSSTVDVASVIVGPDGSGTIDVTIGENSQSGDFTVVIHGAGGFVSAQSTTAFTVAAQPGKPGITGLNPRSLPAGQTLTLLGHGLDQVQSVYIGTVNIPNVQHSGGETLRLTVPLTLQPNQYRVYGQSQKFGRVNCPTMLTVMPASATSERAHA